MNITKQKNMRVNKLPKRNRRKKITQSARRKQAITFQVTGKDKIKFLHAGKFPQDGNVTIPKFFLRLAYNRCRFIEGAAPKICWYYDKKNKRGIFSIDAVTVNDRLVRDENGVHFERME